MFRFDLNADDIKRNNQLSILYNRLNRVSLGGILLPVKNITPRQPRFDIKSRSWLNKFDFGAKNDRTVTYRENPDGTRQEVTVTVSYLKDGSKVTTTEEREVGTATVQISRSFSEDFPFATNNNEFDLDRAKRKRTIKTVTPPNSVTSYTTEIVETVNTSNNKKYTYEKKYTDQQKPVPKGKPATITTVNGTIIDQYLGNAPPQGFDLAHWNQDMYETEQETEETTVDNGDGTETVTKTERQKNARGEITDIVTTTVQKKELDTDGSTVTKTVNTPLTEEKTVTRYDSEGNKVSDQKTTTHKYDSINGGVPTSVEVTKEETTDENGKKVLKTITKDTDLVTGVETTVEEEEIVEPGKDIVKFNRQITYDDLNGVEDIKETRTVTDGYGKTTTEEYNYKKPSSKLKRTVERVISSELEDEYIDDFVNGYLIVEYEVKGQVISGAQAYKIMNKFHEHQVAWAFLAMLEDQLGRGDKLSTTKRQQLYRQWQATFLGNYVDNVRGGPVLDRIEFNCFGEESLPVVFAPSSNAFQIDWIDGSDQLYAWSMTVQTYSPIVREKSGRIGAQPLMGGRYGRSDGEHWYGESTVPELSNPQAFQDNALSFIDTDKGGSWQYD